MWADACRAGLDGPPYQRQPTSPRTEVCDVNWDWLGLSLRRMVIFKGSHFLRNLWMVPKSLSRQLPFRSDEGIFDDEFVEERRQGLEAFINKVTNCALFFSNLRS